MTLHMRDYDFQCQVSQLNPSSTIEKEKTAMYFNLLSYLSKTSLPPLEI